MDKNSSLPQAIVAYIEILGYESLVKRGIEDIGVIQWLEGILAGSSVKLIDDIRSTNLMPLGYENYDGYAHGIFKTINAKFMSDTILVTLPLSDAAQPFQDFSQDELLSNHLHSYFRYISMCTTLFTAKTGLVFRGGIAMGSHYEKAHGDSGSLFLFSEAYVRAYGLEKVARFARILLDGEVLDFLRRISFEQIDEFIYRDEDGKDCFNVYSFFQQDEQSRFVLESIMQTVRVNLKSCREKPHDLEKLLYYANYHNSMVTKLGFRELMINTNV